MTPQDILHDVHREYEGGSTDYPESTSEDFLLRLSYLNAGITAWESEAFDGTVWGELVSEYPGTGAGTGSDDLPGDFLTLLRYRGEDGTFAAELFSGGSVYFELTPAQGVRASKLGMGNFFWISGGKIRSNPAIAGAFTLPYLRKATRFDTGEETTDVEMGIPRFLVDFILSRLYLKDRNSMGFQAAQQAAVESMRLMKARNNHEPALEDSFGFGM